MSEGRTAKPEGWKTFRPSWGTTIGITHAASGGGLLSMSRLSDVNNLLAHNT